MIDRLTSAAFVVLAFALGVLIGRRMLWRELVDERARKLRRRRWWFR